MTEDLTEDCYQALSIAFSIFLTVLALNHGCQHQYYLSHDQLILATKISWIAQPFAIMALATGKISVAFLILRISGTNVWRKAFLNFTMISNFCVCALASIVTYAQCSPANALWTHKGKCWKPEKQTTIAVFTGSKYFNTSLHII